MAELNSTSLLADGSLNAYYRFENANDTTANARHLTPTTTISYNPAKYGNGADLGASNSTLGYDRNDSLGITGTTDFSVSFWLKLQTEISSGEYDLLYFDTITGANRLCIIRYEYNGGTRRLGIYGSGTQANYNITLGTSLYYHIVGTFVRGGGAMNLYVNNAVVATGTTGASSGNGVDKTHIGKADSSSNWTSGILDDMAFFSKILSTTEINTLYNNTGGGFFTFF